MEIAIAVFIGTWISLSAVIAYSHVKREYANLSGKDFMAENEGK